LLPLSACWDWAPIHQLAGDGNADQSPRLGSPPPRDTNRDRDSADALRDGPPDANGEAIQDANGESLQDANGEAIQDANAGELLIADSTGTAEGLGADTLQPDQGALPAGSSCQQSTQCANNTCLIDEFGQRICCNVQPCCKACDKTGLRCENPKKGCN